MGLFASLMGNQQQPGATYPGSGSPAQMPNTQISPLQMPSPGQMPGNIPGAPQIGIQPPAQGNGPRPTMQQLPNSAPQANQTPAGIVSTTAQGAQSGYTQNQPMLMAALAHHLNGGGTAGTGLTSMFDPATAGEGISATPMDGVGSGLSSQFAFPSAAPAAPLGYDAGTGSTLASQLSLPSAAATGAGASEAAGAGTAAAGGAAAGTAAAGGAAAGTAAAAGAAAAGTAAAGTAAAGGASALSAADLAAMGFVLM